MAEFKGFGFTSPEEVVAKTQAGFQQAMASGNPNAMRMAVAQMGAFAVGGSPELRKAKQAQEIFTKASKAAGEEGSDIENQIAFVTEARRLAEEAGLGDIALQSRQQLLQLNNLKLERDKLRADTTRTETETDYTKTQINSAQDKTFREKTEVQLLEEQAKLEGILDKLPEDAPEREKLQNNWDMIEFRKQEIRDERERSKNWKIEQIEVTGADGKPVIRTIRYNEKDPEETVVMGEIPLDEYISATKKGAAGSGRQLATIEKIAHDNMQVAQAARAAKFSAERAATAAGKLVGASRGVRGQIRSSFKQIFGTQDLIEVNQKLVDEVLKTRAIGLLPPGPASDKDVAIVLNTQMDSYGKPEAIKESMGAYYRIKAREEIYANFVDRYLAGQPESPSIIGAQTSFNEWYEANEAEIEAQITNDWRRAMGQEPLPGPQRSDGSARTLSVEPAG